MYSTQSAWERQVLMMLRNVNRKEKQSGVAGNALWKKAPASDHQDSGRAHRNGEQTPHSLPPCWGRKPLQVLRAARIPQQNPSPPRQHSPIGIGCQLLQRAEKNSTERCLLVQFGSQRSSSHTTDFCQQRQIRLSSYKVSIAPFFLNFGEGCESKKKMQSLLWIPGPTEQGSQAVVFLPPLCHSSQITDRAATEAKSNSISTNGLCWSQSHTLKISSQDLHPSTSFGGGEVVCKTLQR